MKNKLSDLTNHLYEQLERLNDNELSSEQLDKECQRAEAMSKIAGNIIGIANTSLNALKLVSNGNISKNDLPIMLTDRSRP